VLLAGSQNAKHGMSLGCNAEVADSQFFKHLLYALFRIDCRGDIFYHSIPGKENDYPLGMIIVYI
jgi:hypothetical protein